MNSVTRTCFHNRSTCINNMYSSSHANTKISLIKAKRREDVSHADEMSTKKISFLLIKLLHQRLQSCWPLWSGIETSCADVFQPTKLDLIRLSDNIQLRFKQTPNASSDVHKLAESFLAYLNFRPMVFRRSTLTNFSVWLFKNFAVQTLVRISLLEIKIDHRCRWRGWKTLVLKPCDEIASRRLASDHWSAISKYN